MIYRLKYDRFNYMVFDISFNEIAAKLGTPFALHDTTAKWQDFWVPLTGFFYDDSDSENVIKIPDITCRFTDDLAMNQRAYDLLKEDLSPYGEFLPITVEGIQYWILHVNKFTDMAAVDEANSSRFIDESTFINLEALAFKEDVIGDLLIFKTEYIDYRNIYCTEKFKTLIENSGLKGLAFTTDLASINEP